MRYFDLHCDTLDLMLEENKGFRNNGFQLDLAKAEYLEEYFQCTAFWIDDNLKKDEAKQRFLDLAEVYEKNFSPHFIATVENCSCLGSDIENVKLFKEKNVKIAGLTWNGDNEIGSGVKGTGNGLSDFGKDVLREFKKFKIVPDVSHSCEKLFWDVVEFSNGPVIATHSNCYKLCNHIRNLKDEQIKAIISKNGIIGVNFFADFLNNSPEKASIDDVFSHVEYILSLGGEKNVAFGSDFDGCSLTEDIVGIESIEKIYNHFLKKNYNEKLIDDIFYGNANQFFTKNCFDSLD